MSECLTLSGLREAFELRIEALCDCQREAFETHLGSIHDLFTENLELLHSENRKLREELAVSRSMRHPTQEASDPTEAEESSPLRAAGNSYANPTQEASDPTEAEKSSPLRAAGNSYATLDKSWALSSAPSLRAEGAATSHAAVDEEPCTSESVDAEIFSLALDQALTIDAQEMSTCSKKIIDIQREEMGAAELPRYSQSAEVQRISSNAQEEPTVESFDSGIFASDTLVRDRSITFENVDNTKDKREAEPIMAGNSNANRRQSRKSVLSLLLKARFTTATLTKSSSSVDSDLSEVCGLMSNLIHGGDALHLLPQWKEMVESSLYNIDVNSASMDVLQMATPPSKSDVDDTKYVQALISPSSFKRLFWDLASICVVTYDTLVIPMAIFEIGQNPLDLFTFVFWNLDMLVSFVSGYEKDSSFDSKFEMRLRKTVFHYLKTWFVFDMLVIVPDWIGFLLDDDDSVGNVQRLGHLAKSSRVLRIIRLLRIFRLTRAWAQLKQRLTNRYVLIFLDIGKLIGLVVVITHYCACIWYGISRMEEGDGWVDRNKLQSATLSYKYFTSLHWSMSQFHGSTDIQAGTDIERLFSVICAFMGMVAASSFISSVTSLMIRTQKLRQQHFFNNNILMRYLEENQISTRLILQIKGFVARAASSATFASDNVELLKLLPRRLQEELDIEIKAKVLKVNTIARHVVTMMPHVQRHMCRHVVKQAIIKPGGLIFESREASSKTFLIHKGKVSYILKAECDEEIDGSTPARAKLRRSITKMGTALSAWSGYYEDERIVEGAAYVAEMSLFTSWRHCGDCMIIGSPSVFAIDAQDLGTMLMAKVRHELDVVSFLAMYAVHYVTWLRQVPAWKLNDLSIFAPVDEGLSYDIEGS